MSESFETSIEQLPQLPPEVDMASESAEPVAPAPDAKDQTQFERDFKTELKLRLDSRTSVTDWMDKPPAQPETEKAIAELPEFQPEDALVDEKTGERTVLGAFNSREKAYNVTRYSLKGKSVHYTLSSSMISQMLAGEGVGGKWRLEKATPQVQESASDTYVRPSRAEVDDFLNEAAVAEPSAEAFSKQTEESVEEAPDAIANKEITIQNEVPSPAKWLVSDPNTAAHESAETEALPDAEEAAFAEAIDSAAKLRFADAATARYAAKNHIHLDPTTLKVIFKFKYNNERSDQDHEWSLQYLAQYDHTVAGVVDDDLLLESFDESGEVVDSIRFSPEGEQVPLALE